jgi:hypothetical protein
MRLTRLLPLLLLASSPALADDAARLRMHLSSPLPVSGGSNTPEPVVDLAFTAQPQSTSLVAGDTAALPFSFEGDPAGAPVVIHDSGMGVPAWVTVSGDTVAVAPPSWTAPMAYGPFRIRLPRADGNVDSDPFTVNVEAVPLSAAYHFPDASMPNAHIMDPVNGGNKHGHPVSGAALSNALGDGLDNPVVSVNFWREFQFLRIGHTQDVMADTCHVRLYSPGMPATAKVVFYVHRDAQPALGGPFRYQITKGADGWAEYTGPCMPASNGEWIRSVTLGIDGIINTTYTITEFKIGHGGRFPTVPAP